MANATYVGVNGVARKVSKKYVGVDSVARKISKGYVGVDGVARKFFGGEPWEEAAALVGYSPASLDALLKNSTICKAIAGNTTATSIMKTNYSSNITSYIDSNWNAGLNFLSFKCKLKCYLFKAGNECTDITGGWSIYIENDLAGAMTKSSNTGSAILLGFSRDNGEGGYVCRFYAKTKNSISASGYKTVYWNLNQCGQKSSSRYIYSNTTQLNISSNRGNMTKSLTMATGQQYYRWDQQHVKVGAYMEFLETYIYNVYITP